MTMVTHVFFNVLLGTSIFITFVESIFVIFLLFKKYQLKVSKKHHLYSWPFIEQLQNTNLLILISHLLTLEHMFALILLFNC